MKSDFEQCQRQDWQAKASEYALAIFLSDRFGLPFILPDMQHYRIKHKRYSPDLQYEDVKFFEDKYDVLNLHCKSCDCRTRDECRLDNGYSGESYAFCYDVRRNGTGIDPLFVNGGRSDWIGCVYLPFEGTHRCQP